MKTRSIIISSVVAVALVSTSIVGFLVKQKSGSDKYANWMSQLDDNVSLRTINMPGSHDTMALYSIAD